MEDFAIPVVLGSKEAKRRRSTTAKRRLKCKWLRRECGDQRRTAGHGGGMECRRGVTELMEEGPHQVRGRSQDRLENVFRASIS